MISRYNNKTYRVDDIDWNKHPTDYFEKQDGSRITFKEYYAAAYQKTPTDDLQPMLISNPKEKDRKRGMAGPILLLPEFCYISGKDFVLFVRSNQNSYKSFEVISSEGYCLQHFLKPLYYLSLNLVHKDKLLVYQKSFQCF